MVNLSLPLRGRPHIRLSMLRAASLHEAPNFLNSTTFFNSKFKIQDSKLVKAESGIEPLSAFFVGRVGVKGVMRIMEFKGV